MNIPLIPDPGPYGHIPPCWYQALTTGKGHTPVSVNIIAKNEGPRIARVLASLIPLAPMEVIVADTGSDDKTADVARWFGCTVVEVPWRDHFAEARNTILDLSTQDWIVWVDADEQFAEGSAERLKKRLAAGELIHDYQLFRYSEYPFELFQSRMFRRIPRARWKGRVHEQVWPDGPVQSHGDIVIFQHPDERRPEKYHRNINLLSKAIEEDPACYHNFLHAAVLYNITGDLDKSVQFAERYLSSSTKADLRPRIYMLYLLAWTAMTRKDYQKSLNLIMSGLAMEACAAELWSLLGDIYSWVGRYTDACTAYENAIHFGKFSTGTFWLVDRAKYEVYPQDRLAKLAAMGYTRMYARRNFSAEVP